MSVVVVIGILRNSSTLYDQEKVTEVKFMVLSIWFAMFRYLLFALIVQLARYAFAMMTQFFCNIQGYSSNFQ